MKTHKIILLVMFFAGASIYAQNIELSFIKLDEKNATINAPESSNSKDQLLIVELFGLEKIKNYQEISCIIETNDFHVDEYTFPIVFTSNSEEFYTSADESKNYKPGTKYKRLIVTGLPDAENPNGISQFNISFTRNACGYKYVYSKQGCADFKEYTLKAKVVGQNYEKRYDPKTDMYYNVASHDPVLLSNIATIKIVTSPKVDKQEIDLTIGKKSELFDLINQSNEQTGNSPESGKKKKKN